MLVTASVHGFRARLQLSSLYLYPRADAKGRSGTEGLDVCLGVLCTFPPQSLTQRRTLHIPSSSSSCHPIAQEHHGGSISNLQLWKDQVHPKNVLRDFSKTLAEVFQFDDSVMPPFEDDTGLGKPKAPGAPLRSLPTRSSCPCRLFACRILLHSIRFASARVFSASPLSPNSLLHSASMSPLGKPHAYLALTSAKVFAGTC